MTCVFGSDNGKSGFLVFLDFNKRIKYIEQYSTGLRLYEILKQYNPVYAVTEQVFMSSGFAHVASTGFTILGRYQQCFELLNIKYEAVRAVSWRKKLDIKAKGRQEQKEAAINYCKEAFHKDDQHLLMSEVSHIVNHKREKTLIYDNNKCESTLISLYALIQYQSLNKN